MDPFQELSTPRHLSSIISNQILKTWNLGAEPIVLFSAIGWKIGLPICYRVLCRPKYVITYS